MDVGDPISYEVLAAGTPVCSSDGQEVGVVTHVLAVDEQDIFDGIVIEPRLSLRDHRFVDASEVDSIHERRVTLKLDAAQCKALPAPSANPAAMEADADTTEGSLARKLHRAWDVISGNY